MEAARAIPPWKPFLVLAVSLSLSGLAVWLTFSNAEAKDQVRFENRSQRTEDLIRGRLDDYVILLRSAGYFFASNTPGGAVRPQDFRAFVERLDLARSHPGLTRIGYARSDDHGHVPVELAEPLGRLAGRDLGAEPRLQPALAWAVDSGGPAAASRPGPPLEDLDSPGGFFMCVPVYRDGFAPEDAAARREALEGYVFGIFRLDALLRDLYSGPMHPGIAYEIYAGREILPEELLFRSESMVAASRTPEFSATTRLDFAGRTWTLRYVTVPPFGEGSTRGQGWIALLLSLGASGALFWAAWSQHKAAEQLRRSEDDVRRLNLDLERRVQDRTAQLEAANRELEAFSYSVSHDLRGPLRSIDGFSQMLVDQYADRLDSRGRDYLARVLGGTAEMGALIEGFLKLARVSRAEMRSDAVDLSAMAEDIARDLQGRSPGRKAEIRIEPGIRATGDSALLRVVLENLLGNAWKFTSKRVKATIEFGLKDGACFVRDDGAGFDMADAARLFTPFERLHSAADFPGTGVGLATVRRIVERHGGEIQAEAALDRGALFTFTLEKLEKAVEAEART